LKSCLGGERLPDDLLKLRGDDPLSVYNTELLRSLAGGDGDRGKLFVSLFNLVVYSVEILTELLVG